MNKIIHPISGENGYFCSEKEKVLIDAILSDWNSAVLLESSASNSRGVSHD